ncbi:MAG TPA: hypothetical protein VKH19_12915 [Gemmatimonadaceae bacterium]|nr:hypothetical protein [Gemmatimonadaceae bacterium]
MRSILPVLVALQLALPPFFGADKVKHFLLSFLVQSTGYSVSRAAGLDRGASQAIGGAGVATVGLLKEFHDKRNGKPFSIGDLAVDGAGGLAAAALLNGTR